MAIPTWWDAFTAGTGWHAKHLVDVNGRAARQAIKRGRADTAYVTARAAFHSVLVAERQVGLAPPYDAVLHHAHAFGE